MNFEVLLLLIFFNCKHLVGDFVLQSHHMVMGKGQQGWAFVGPLAFHCLVHVALSATIIFFFFGLKFLWFLPVEFAVHFVIDRLKSGPKYGGQFSMTEKPKTFWTLFGTDQLLHQLTYILFIFFINTNGKL